MHKQFFARHVARRGLMNSRRQRDGARYRMLGETPEPRSMLAVTASVTQEQAQEIGRKVVVLGQLVGQDWSESQEPTKQLMGDACTMPQMEDMSKAQKILDLFDVISETVCEIEEHRLGNVEDNKLMPEVISLRAAQLALIQDDYDYAIDTVAEVKDTFILEGYAR